MVKEYAHLLRDDPAYADKARRIVELTQDVCGVPADATTAAGISAAAARRSGSHSILPAPCSTD